MLGIIAALLLLTGTALAQTAMVPVPPSLCNGTNQALQWGPSGWSCATISGGGGGSGTPAQPGLPGIVNIFWNGTAYIAQYNSTTICSSSPTSCMQEGINYAVSNGYYYAVIGAGPANPLTITNATLTIPATVTTPFICTPSCYFQITQIGASAALPGIVIDTMQHAGFANKHGVINYSGNGAAVVIQPQTTVTGTDGQTVFTLDNDFEFGTIQAMGGTPTALLVADPTKVCTSQYISSSIGPNFISAKIESNLKAIMGFQVLSPSCQWQVFGQNTINLISECASNSEIYLGTWSGSANDINIGANNFFGQATHCQNNANTYVMIDDGESNRFYMTSFDLNVAGLGYAVYFGPRAYNEHLEAGQSFGWSIAPFFNAGSPSIPNVMCGYSAGTMC